MAHMIMADDTMAYRASGGPTWHHLGNPISDDVGDAEFFNLSGLDWQTLLVPALYLPGDGPRMADDYKAIVRSTDGKLLGFCTDSFHPVQNSQVWEFFQRFCEAGEMRLETAGSLCGGRKVWALAKMDAQFTLPGTSDTTVMYALFSTGHEPGYATQAEITRVRVVCYNTLTAARGFNGQGGDGEKYGRFRLSHLAKWTEGQAEQARDVVLKGREALLVWQAQAERLAATRTEPQIDLAYLTELFQPEVGAAVLQAIMEGRDFEPQRLVESKAVQQAAGRRLLNSMLIAGDYDMQRDLGRRLLDGLIAQQERITPLPTVGKVFGLITDQPGADQVGETLWNTANAVSHYVDNVRGRDGAAAIDSALFGPGRDLKTRAFQLADDYATRLGTAVN